MKDSVNEVYNMLYSPIVTPYDLLENAKLRNYSYVKYYTNDTGLVAEMQCTIPCEGNQVFFYQFDKNDYLQLIYQNEMKDENIVFSRKESVETAVRKSEERYEKDWKENK